MPPTGLTNLLKLPKVLDSGFRGQVRPPGGIRRGSAGGGKEPGSGEGDTRRAVRADTCSRWHPQARCLSRPSLQTTYGTCMASSHLSAQETPAGSGTSALPAIRAASGPMDTGLPAVSPGGECRAHTDAEMRRHTLPEPRGGPAPSSRRTPASPRGASRAPRPPARPALTCLEVSAVMPRMRPPSREEKGALAAAGPAAPGVCRKSPGSAVSVFSTMSLIAAAAARLHARPSPPPARPP